MTDTPDRRVATVLAELERKSHLANYDVACALESIREELYPRQDIPASAYQWEFIASTLDLRFEQTEWGTAFGPEMSYTNKEGVRIDSPSLESITPECLNYWQARMNESRHPVLRARYADAIWEFTKITTSIRPSVDAANIAIDSYVESVVTDRIASHFTGGQFIKRAISLVLEINNPKRLETCCRTTVDYATLRTDKDEGIDLLLPLFNCMLEIPRRRQPANILDEIAATLRRHIDGMPKENIDQWALESIVISLARYYRSRSKADDVAAILGCYVTAVSQAAIEASAMLAVKWLQRLHDLLVEFEQHGEAKRVLGILQQRQIDVPDEMTSHSVPITITDHEMDDWLSQIIIDDLPKSLRRIANCFIPRLEDERATLASIQKEAIAASLITTTIVDIDGRTVSAIGPADEDPEGHLVRHISQQTQFCDMLLEVAFTKLIERFKLNADDLLSEVLRAPLWRSDRLPVLRRGVEAFINGDSIVAAHLLIPEAESAIRTLAQSVGATIQKSDRRKRGMMLKNLDDLLREERVVQILGEDLVTYLRTILTDQRGRNLRNDVCHGIKSADELGPRTAARIMHVIIVLGMIRTRECPDVGQTYGN